MQIAALANMQISAGETDVAIGGGGLCGFFYFFFFLRDLAWTVSVGALFAHVPGRFPLCLSLFIRQPLAKNEPWQLTCERRNSRMTNADYLLKRCACFVPLL